VKPAESLQNTVRLVPPDGVALDFPLAGMFVRMMAYLVDLVVLVLLWVCLGLVFMGTFDQLTAADPPAGVLGVLFLFWFVTNWGYSVFWELAMRGQTPGKRMLGLRVLRQDGMPVGYRESALRNLWRVVDMMPAPFYGIGCLSLLLDRKARRLGDLVAGTLVIRESQPESRGTHSGALWAVRAERGHAHKGLILPHGSVSAQKLAVIEEFLNRRTTMAAEQREKLAGRLLAPILEMLDEPAQALSKLQGPEATLARIVSLAQVGESAPAPSQSSGRKLF